MTTNQDEHDDYAARFEIAAHTRTEEEHRREIETAVAQAVAAEREAIRAEIERQQRSNVGAGWERGFNFADLLAWLDARSKGGAK